MNGSSDHKSPTDFYFYATTASGSNLLEPLCDRVGLQIDKVNFVFAHLVFILLSLIYKWLLTDSRTSATTRHLYLIVPSLLFGYFCFGLQVLNLVLLTLLTYVLIRFCPANVVQNYLLASSMVYLSCLHLVRQIYDYGNFTYDVSAAAMIAVQKITMLGFSIHDGLSRKSDSLLEIEAKVAVRRMPTFLEYVSYVFNLCTFLSGPCIHFHDYIEFVEGTNYSKHIKNAQRPSSTMVWLYKLFTAFTCAAMSIYLAPLVPVERLNDDSFQNSAHLIQIVIYMVVSTTLARFKYYFAWKMGESHLNCCGFGFNGFDERTKKPKWDLVSSVDIVDHEVSMSLRASLETWNKSTQRWLRFVAYDRVRRFRVLYTYFFSALWHGFYSGYYLTFLSGALFTMAGRSFRRHLRPLFLVNERSKFFYDLLTSLAAKLSIAYLVTPFVLLEFDASIKAYDRMYFLGHLICLFGIYLLPSLVRLYKDCGDSAGNSEQKDQLKID